MRQMDPKEIAAKLENLQKRIVHGDWYIHKTLYSIMVRTTKPMHIRIGKYYRHVKMICTVCAPGILASPEREANAEFICLTKNSLPQIIKALKHLAKCEKMTSSDVRQTNIDSGAC